MSDPRGAAITRLRWTMAVGLALHLAAYVYLVDEGTYGIASSLAQFWAHATTYGWTHWYLSVPVGVGLYHAVERRLAERAPLYLLDEVVRLATVLWLGAILALWYPSHRLCNCVDYLSETNSTVATLPALAVVLFALGVRTQRRSPVDR